MPADPAGILGYEPAEIRWFTHPSWALFVAAGLSISSIRRMLRFFPGYGVTLPTDSSSDCVYKFSVYWLFGGELFLIFFFFFFFFVAAVGFIAGFFLCHFGLVVLVSFP